MTSEYDGLAERGLGRMLGKKVERETLATERKESPAHEMMESRAYEKAEHKLMRDGKSRMDRKTALTIMCPGCKKETTKGNYCKHCGYKLV